MSLKKFSRKLSNRTGQDTKYIRFHDIYGYPVVEFKRPSNSSFSTQIEHLSKLYNVDAVSVRSNEEETVMYFAKKDNIPTM